MPGSSSLQLQCFAQDGKYAVVYVFYALHVPFTQKCTHSLPAFIFCTSDPPTQEHKSSLLACTTSPVDVQNQGSGGHSLASDSHHSCQFSLWITDSPGQEYSLKKPVTLCSTDDSSLAHHYTILETLGTNTNISDFQLKELSEDLKLGLRAFGHLMFS